MNSQRRTTTAIWPTGSRQPYRPTIHRAARALATTQVSMPTLTQRRQLQTRAEIAEAAVALFLSTGFTRTTMDDVAMASGVSRRTVYRYFPAKEDLVFEYPRRWFEHFQRCSSNRVQGESVRSLVSRSLLEVAESVEENHEQVLAAFSVLHATESLRGTHGKNDEQWMKELVRLLRDEPSYDDGVESSVMVLAATVIATSNIVIGRWAETNASFSLIEEMTTALDQIKSVWPERFY